MSVNRRGRVGQVVQQAVVYRPRPICHWLSFLRELVHAACCKFAVGAYTACTYSMLYNTVCWNSISGTIVRFPRRATIPLGSKLFTHIDIVSPVSHSRKLGPEVQKGVFGA